MLPEPYIRIAVISDLHCEDSRNNPKHSRLNTELLEHSINGNPITSFKNLIKSKTTDYLFVLGDLTDQAYKGGFNLGIRYVQEIYNILHAKKLIFAIGNHDVYRLKTDDKRQDPFEMMRDTENFPFILKDHDDKATQSLKTHFMAKHYCIVEDTKSIILVLNTSYAMTHENNLTIMDFSNFEVHINNSLNSLKPSEKIRIAICHHHPIPHSDINYKGDDCIDGSDSLMSLLKKHNFTIIMHGHKHFTRLKEDHGIPVFCSGSFSAFLDSFRHNTAHFVNVFKIQQGLSTVIYKGTIETWFYGAGGWDSDSRPDFPIYSGFGATETPINLANKVASDFFSTETPKEIQLSDVIEQFEDVIFLMPDQQKLFEDELEKYNIEIINSKKGRMIRKM